MQRHHKSSLPLGVVVRLTRRVGAFALVAARAAVVRGRRAVPVAAVVVVPLAVAPAAAVVVVVSVPAPVVAIITSAAYSRLAHIDARRGRVCALCDREVNPDATSIYLHTGTLVLSHFGILLVLVVDKTETTRATRLSINDNLHFVHWSIFGEDMVDLRLCGVQTETENAEAPRWSRVLPIALMTAT